jgi:hypothetical protein
VLGKAIWCVWLVHGMGEAEAREIRDLFSGESPELRIIMTETSY